MKAQLKPGEAVGVAAEVVLASDGPPPGAELDLLDETAGAPAAAQLAAQLYRRAGRAVLAAAGAVR